MSVFFGELTTSADNSYLLSCNFVLSLFISGRDPFPGIYVDNDLASAELNKVLDAVQAFEADFRANYPKIADLMEQERNCYFGEFFNKLDVDIQQEILESEFAFWLSEWIVNIWELMHLRSFPYPIPSTDPRAVLGFLFDWDQDVTLTFYNEDGTVFATVTSELSSMDGILFKAPDTHPQKPYYEFLGWTSKRGSTELTVDFTSSTEFWPVFKELSNPTVIPSGTSLGGQVIC